MRVSRGMLTFMGGACGHLPEDLGNGPGKLFSAVDHMI